MSHGVSTSSGCRTCSGHRCVLGRYMTSGACAGRNYPAASPAFNDFSTTCSSRRPKNRRDAKWT
ncbi:hypothetical protein STXM2123_1308 [Streptomyces sp. F-3]|nr:hypothetical protein STXM2123_1308 [Streptomyces sp. F-3]